MSHATESNIGLTAAPGELSVGPIMCQEAVGPDIPGAGVPTVLLRGTTHCLNRSGTSKNRVLNELGLETAWPKLGWPVQPDTASSVTKV